MTAHSKRPASTTELAEFKRGVEAEQRRVKLGKHFWCHSPFCFRRAIEELAQQLGRKKLCRECYNDGLRLQYGIVVTRAAETMPDGVDHPDIAERMKVQK